MKIADKTCVDFVEVLSSKEAVPGGGGAAALVGAIGMALGSMVCNLTIGKKKYAEYEESVKEILSKAGKLEKDLLKMIDDDAECFLPYQKLTGFLKKQKKKKE
ncbi:methenyltetrahydrofolate cyclohydrolase [Clostridioides difficile P6]|nr:methenyltetrahydrofolate cyclohydrolase [Clostridioides difficile P6]